ncbi:uncharacterized protein [Elaeis guineensis]|uniref:Methyltransferase-like protein 7A n=1 Tax=Elaeis guineensis var. tenera TaxID=51953 RepID=A0A6I9S3P0_ELAGV|nr:methyltransferase-like protein 7A [Elaeis guineensis]
MTTLVPSFRAPYKGRPGSINPQNSSPDPAGGRRQRGTMYSSVSVLSSTASPLLPLPRTSSLPPSKARTLTLTLARSSPTGKASPEPVGLVSDLRLSRALQCCTCGRRLGLLGGTAAVALFRVPPPQALGDGPPDPEDMVERFHPSRPDWYEELYAKVLEQGMIMPYEAEVAAYKAKIFSQLTGKSKKILELGVGTGPNFKYYASATDINVIGVDPNKKMEKYAQAAAVAAGLPLTNFSFMRGVGEALPVRDETMDTVIGTLVLCSVKDVDMALREIRRVLKPGGLYLFIEHVAARDGSLIRCVQSILDPLQQFVSDGCHLTRETGRLISETGFSSVDLNTAFLSSAAFLGPHVYGIARK